MYFRETLVKQPQALWFTLMEWLFSRWSGHCRAWWYWWSIPAGCWPWRDSGARLGERRCARGGEETQLTQSHEGVPWQLKPLPTSLFVQKPVQANITEHYWPFVRGMHLRSLDSPLKGPVTQKAFSCHNSFMWQATASDCSSAAAEYCQVNTLPIPWLLITWLDTCVARISAATQTGWLHGSMSSISGRISTRKLGIIKYANIFHVFSQKFSTTKVKNVCIAFSLYHWCGVLLEESETHFSGLVQERHNSSALAVELHLSCTNPSIWFIQVIMYWPIKTRDLSIQVKRAAREMGQKAFKER